MKAIYFKGLNGIRAIACLIVVFFHIDQFLEKFDLPELGYHKSDMAGYGVVLFFVLSGYLITFLMLVEKKEFGKVELLKFYKRRILRIWPIYYLVILLTLVLIYLNIISLDSDTFISLILYSLLLSNVGYSFGYGIVSITPLWSVGVEEQFYAFWPFLLNKNRNVFVALISVIFIYLALKIGLRFFENGIFYSLVVNSAFDSMAIGGLASYLIFHKRKVVTYLYNPLLQIFCWLFFIVSVFYKPIHVTSLFDKEIHSVVYAIIIINVSTNRRSLINLENGLLNFIGRISYGMYVYHMIVIVILSYFFHSYISLVGSRVNQYILVYGSVIGVTIIISYLSYTYFESYFLLLKKRLAKVDSTNKQVHDERV